MLLLQLLHYQEKVSQFHGNTSKTHLMQNIHQVLISVHADGIMAFSAVKNDRQVQIDRHLQLLTQSLFLESCFLVEPEKKK